MHDLRGFDTVNSRMLESGFSENLQVPVDLEFSSKRRTNFVLHFIGVDRGQIRFVFSEFHFFYIRSTCKFNPLRFNHDATLARSGRAPRISYAGRSRPKTYPLVGVRFLAAALRWPGLKRRKILAPTAEALERQQRRPGSVRSAGRVRFES